MAVDFSVDIDDDPVVPDRRAEATVRRRAVDALGVLGSPRQERYDRMTRLACNIFGVTFATIAIADGDSFRVQSTFADWGSEYPLPAELFRAAMHAERPLVIPDLSLDDSPAELRAAADGAVRFFTGASLRDSQGVEIGAFCIGDRRARTLDDGLLAVFTDLVEWVRREMILSSDSIRARALQKRLLPAEAPRIPGYQVHATCVRAGGVGGDFYDWQPVDSGDALFMLADVVGKGTAAAIMSGTLRGALRSALTDATASPGTGRRLAEPVARTAKLMFSDLQGTGKFATVFLCTLSPAEHRLTWIDAGHGLAVIAHADGTFTWLGRGDLPIGVTADATWKEHVTTFRPGDTLLIFSDGLLELDGAGLRSLGDVQQLVARLASPDKVIDTIARSAGAGVPVDDVTAVALHRLVDLD